MKPVCLCALVWLTAVSVPVAAADAGIYTIVEGDARVLRGTAWAKLGAGVRAQEGDLLELGERAQVQVEMPRAGVMNIVGPASVYAAALPAQDAKAGGAGEMAPARGWALGGCGADAGRGCRHRLCGRRAVARGAVSPRVREAPDAAAVGSGVPLRGRGAHRLASGMGPHAASGKVRGGQGARAEQAGRPCESRDPVT